MKMTDSYRMGWNSAHLAYTGGPASGADRREWYKGRFDALLKAGITTRERVRLHLGERLYGEIYG